MRHLLDAGDPWVPIWRNYLLSLLTIKLLEDIARDAGVDKSPWIDLRLPESCSFYRIYQHRLEAGVGSIISSMVSDLEHCNPAILGGAFAAGSFDNGLELDETRARTLTSLIELVKAVDLRPSAMVAVNGYGHFFAEIIDYFAAFERKSAHFNVPPGPSRLVSQLLDPKPGSSIHDPSCGAGSLLAAFASLHGNNFYDLSGQESDAGQFSQCKVNMLFNGILSARIEQSDCLHSPMVDDAGELMKFDVVVSNPPYGLANWGSEQAKVDRFSRFWRGVPPKGRADYAFLSHMVESARADTGKIAALLPAGVLFRGGNEAIIRESIVQENLIECVLALPASLFYGSSIPVVLLILNKGKSTSNILFIDASRDFVPENGRNAINEIHELKILNAFKASGNVEGYSYTAGIDEVRAQDYNLDVSRYVRAPVADLSIEVLATEIQAIEGELAGVQKKLVSSLEKLGLSVGSGKI